jgi:hypothetical protein
MRVLRLLALGVSAHFMLLSAAGQQSAPPQQPVATAAGSERTFTEQLRKTVGFLKVVYRDGADMKAISGTCFFVYVEDKRLGQNRGIGYMVTNRHMAEPGIERGLRYPVESVLLRLNLRSAEGENESLEMAIPLGPETHWFFPDDKSVDLAVLIGTPDVGRFDFQTISTALFATAEQLGTSRVEAGQQVVFAGYFYQFPGEKRIEPIVRQGVLAMMPDEKIETTLQKPGQLYLADTHAFHGNSGSPLFVNVGGIQGGVLSGNHYFLAGIISGYYPEGESFSIPAATVLTGEVHDNSGIATVVPVGELSKLLNSHDVQADRDARVQAMIGQR